MQTRGKIMELCFLNFCGNPVGVFHSEPAQICKDVQDFVFWDCLESEALFNKTGLHI